MILNTRPACLKPVWRQAVILLLLTLLGEPPEAAKQMHDVATELRHGRGLAVQRLDDELCKLAQSHADWMASTNRLDHGPNDQIIAYNFTGIPQAMQQWTGSPPHAVWLYGNSERCGWGLAKRGAKIFFCGVFRGSGPSVRNPVTTNNYRPRRRFFRLRRRR